MRIAIVCLVLAGCVAPPPAALGPAAGCDPTIVYSPTFQPHPDDDCVSQEGPDAIAYIAGRDVRWTVNTDGSCSFALSQLHGCECAGGGVHARVWTCRAATAQCVVLDGMSLGATTDEACTSLAARCVSAPCVFSGLDYETAVAR